MPEQPVKQMSVSDAFGSLPEGEDRPLPPLPVATAAVPEEADVAGGDDDFGKFDGAGVEGSAVEGDEGFGQFDSSGHLDSKSYAVTDTQSAVEEDEVGGFGGTNFGPGQLDSNANDEMNAQPAVEDEFGDFDTSNIGLDSNAFDERNAQPAVEDEFGDFGTVNIGQPAATGIGTAAVKDFGGTCSDQPVGAGFGAGGESGQFDSNQLGSSDRLGSISNGDGDTQPAVEDDEFGDFGTSIGQPAATGVGQSREGLPSPDVSFGAGTAQDITKGISEQQQKISQHADPDIGGLETVDVKLAADHVAGIEFGNWGGSEVVSLDDPDTTPLGVAGTISTNSNDQVGVGQVLSISDAFGEIEEDAPLPSLSALSSTVEVVSDEVQSISADPGRAVPKEGGLSNDGRDFGFAEPLDEGTDAALPDVAGDTPAPLNVVADSAEVHSTDSIIEDIYEQHVATEDANNIFSAFDALAPADAPLPLMSDMAFIVPKVTEADTISTKISEEGALGEQNAEESPYSQFRAEDNAPEKNVPEMLSAFDVLGVHDAPLPSLDDPKHGQSGGLLSFEDAPVAAVQSDAIGDAAGDVDDDFHGFTSFSGTPLVYEQLQEDGTDSKDGQSGGILSFEDAPATAVQSDAMDDAAGGVDDDFHGFTSFSGASLVDEQLQEDGSDSKVNPSRGFSALDDAPVTAVQSDAMDDAAGGVDDDFHGFASFSGTSPAEPVSSDVAINEAIEVGGPTREDEEDNFGAFDDFASSDNVKPTNFADYPPEPAEEGFEDFSTFEEPGPLVSDDEEIRNASSLAQALLKKYGSEFAGLPRVWKEISATVESDMRRGIRILDYMSTKLSRADQSLIVKSDKISIHILGLVEFLRVIRSIAASIGDLLGVDKSAMLQESNLSEWHFEDLIVNAAVVENLYTNLISRAVSIGILSEPPSLPSVAEIRKSNGSGTTFTFCHLTLQAISEDESTKSVVIWKDRPFMACSANFCSNRLPTLDVLS